MKLSSKTWVILAGATGMLAPALASAQQLTNIRNLLNSVVGIVNVLIPLMMALAVLAFFWGLVRVLFSKGGAEAGSQGRTLMIWGVITLFVMAAVWGLVQFIAGNLGVATGGTIESPTVNTATF